MKIIAIIMVFNCGDVVLDTLKSIDGKVDEIRCFDNRWVYASEKYGNYSSDDTKVIIENFGLASKSKVSYIMLPSPLSEGKSRTLSIENIEEGDWVFVIDSDERVIEWNSSGLGENSELGYCIFLDKIILPICRLFKKMEGMKYFGDKIYSPTGKIYNVKEDFKSIEIVIQHYFKERKRQPRASTYAQGPHP
jgi:glycosyltransferase involved in cell wall biosynthesis